MSGVRIAVVGAGVAGLTTAAALATRGIRCVVFERAGGLPDAGGGIQISPNGARVLHRLGLAPDLRAAAVRPVAVELRRWQDGRLLGRIDLDGAEQRYGAPYYALRRTDLNRMLLSAVAARCDPGTVRFAQRCVAVVRSPRPAGQHGIDLRFADGGGYRADVVIGADGIHSVVRRSLADDAVRFSGHTVYRAMVDATRLPWLSGPPRVVVWLGPGQHSVCYPVDSRGTINVVATVASARPPRGRVTGDPRLLAAAYRAWHDDVRTLLAAAGSFVHHGLFDRPPLPRWRRGGIAVVGDAAHPMLPFLAQGANQAIEDADVLAATLRAPADLARYESLRRPRIDRVDAAVRASIHRHHLGDGAQQRLRDRQLAAADLADQDWLYR
jgi:salicylate hydroxylase